MEMAPHRSRQRNPRFKLWRYDDEPLAIAETMPELRHLKLFGNGLTNLRLEAILDNCVHLVHLDLRRCFNINPFDASSDIYSAGEDDYDFYSDDSDVYNPYYD